MDNISFLIKNKSEGEHHTRSFLYRDGNNMLDFEFTNNDLGDLPFTQGNTITINIPTDLLKSASKDQFESAGNWELTNDPSTVNDGVYQYIFTPKKGKTVYLYNSGSLTISLQKLQGGNASNDNVSLVINVGANVPVGPPQKVFVFNAPQEGDKVLNSDILNPSVYVNQLQGNVPNGAVFISRIVKNVINPPIANTIHLNLTFSGSTLAKSWPQDKIPNFNFSFSYADYTAREEALTNAIKQGKTDYNPLTTAWEINSPTEDNKVKVDQANLWEAQELIQNSATPSWEVEATTSNTTLFSSTNRKLDVHFTHIISVLEGEDTTVFIQWDNIPGYYSGIFALNLPKQVPEPRIISFTTQEDSYSSHDHVVLNWETFGANQVDLSWTNNANSKSSEQIPFSTFPAGTAPALTYSGSNKAKYGYAVPPFMASAVSYTCRLKILGPDATQKELTLNLDAANAPVINSFSADILTTADTIKVVIIWQVITDNVNAYCVLEGIDGLFPLKGSHDIELNPSQFLPTNLTLTVKGFYPEVTRTLSQSLEVKRSIAGLHVLGIQPNTNRLFLTNGENRIYYCDANNIPVDIANPANKIKIGSLNKSQMALFFSPNGERAFAINFNDSTQNNEVFYFDPSNPVAEVTDSIKMTDFAPIIYFLPDSSRAFVKSSNGKSITYFDPANPPKEITPQISVPAGPPLLNPFELYYPPELAISLDGTKAFTWSPTNESLVVYYFDPNNPPAVITEGIALNASEDIYIKFSPDNTTVFISEGGNRRVSYFPLDTPPAKIETFVKLLPENSNGDIAISAKTNWAFVSMLDGDLRIAYFDCTKPPCEASTGMLFPGEHAQGTLVLNPSQDTVFCAFTVVGSLCYFNTIDPPQFAKTVNIGTGPFAIFFTLNGSRIFVNTFSSPGNIAVCVLEISYVKKE